MKIKRILLSCLGALFLVPMMATVLDTLPPDFPEIETVVYGETAKGNIFLSPIAPTPYKLYVIEDDGNVVSYTESLVGQRFLDFKEVDDTTYIYHTDPAWGDPAYYVCDTLYNTIDSFRAGNDEVLDSHDIWLLENGHAYVIVYESRVVDMSQVVTGGNPAANVTGLTIQEVDNQQNVYWEWSSFDHFEITDGISQGGSSMIDFTLANITYVHCNSIVVDEDGNLLISSRNLHEVTKINRNTGEVMWRMGGQNNQFTFVDDPFEGFTDQHDAQWTGPNTMIVFDNGNFHNPPTSRAVEYEIDETNMTATLIWEYQNPYGSLSAASGNVQRLDNGNTLLGWGIISPNSAPVITEVDADNEIVFELSFLNNGMPANQFTYRAFRFAKDMGVMSTLASEPMLEKELNVYPNPGHSTLHFASSEMGLEKGELTIMDAQGRIIQMHTIGANDNFTTFDLDVSDLNAGMYFYELKTKKELYKGKFLIGK